MIRENRTIFFWSALKKYDFLLVFCSLNRTFATSKAKQDEKINSFLCDNGYAYRLFRGQETL